MSYGYAGGLGALGWDKSWQVPMSSEVARNVGCAGGGTLTCAGQNEQNFMANQGCVPSVYPANGLDACTTGAGTNGSLFCCPPGRPGTAETPGGTVMQQSVSGADIRRLQNFIIGEGCDVGRTGADGIYGPNTARGLDCAIARSSYVNVAGQFPFITTLMATPTGQERPESFTFDPGMIAKTPEQMVASGSRRVSGSGSTQRDVQLDERRREEAGIIGGLPWWGWGLISVGGVVMLGAVYMMLTGEEDDKQGSFDRERRLLTEMYERGAYSPYEFEAAMDEIDEEEREYLARAGRR